MASTRMMMDGGRSSYKRTTKNQQIGKSTSQIDQEEKSFYERTKNLPAHIKALVKADEVKAKQNTKSSISTAIKKAEYEAKKQRAVESRQAQALKNAASSGMPAAAVAAAGAALGKIAANNATERENKRQQLQSLKNAIDTGTVPAAVAAKIAPKITGKPVDSYGSSTQEIKDYVNNTNIPDYAKEDVIKSMVESGANVGDYTNENILKKLEEGKRIKEQDALYDMGGDLSEEDQQMVDEIRAGWRSDELPIENISKYYGNRRPDLNFFYENISTYTLDDIREANLTSAEEIMNNAQNEYNEQLLLPAEDRYKDSNSILFRQETMRDKFLEYKNLYENKLANNIVGDTGVYYEDSSIQAGAGPGGISIGVEGGVGYVININEGWIAQYSHLGPSVGFSNLPIMVEESKGVVYGDASIHSNYINGFWQFNAGGLTKGSANASAEFKKQNEIVQGSTEFSITGVGTGASYGFYKLNNVEYYHDKINNGE